MISRFNGPLCGIRILDLTRLYPGPLATMMLGDMGAEVIKVEDVDYQDYIRTSPPFIESESAGYLALNRSKKSVVFNLREPQGKEIFFKLAAKSDIVIEQFRPGVAEKIGIGYQAVSHHNRQIIYVSLTGYGQYGPYAKEAGHDVNYVGYCGILATTGNQQSGPVLPGPQIADVSGSYMTIIACLSALWARNSNGKGQKVDVAMLDGALPMMTLQLAHHWAQGTSHHEFPLSGGSPSYAVYRCKDGKHIALGALEPKFWERFCQEIGREDWQEIPYAESEEKQQLQHELQDLFAQQTQEEWMAMGKDWDVCLSPVSTMEEVATDPHIKEREMVITQQHPVCGEIKQLGVPLKFSQTPATPSSPPPSLGQHTREILGEIGYGEDEIEQLKTKGIIFTGKDPI